MENDMLSRLTMNEDTKLLARKLFRIALVLLVLDVIFCVASLFEWYLVVDKVRSSSRHPPNYVFQFIIRPALVVVEVVMSLIAYVLNYRAYGSINAAIGNQEPVLINQGFRNIFIVFLLTGISFLLEIFCSAYESFLIK